LPATYEGAGKKYFDKLRKAKNLPTITIASS
jgi:hypothetical protein